MPNFGQNLLGILSGGDQPQYNINPQTGDTEATMVKPSTGQMFKNMFAGMLSGLAGGVEANANGAHGALGAIAGGYEAATKATQLRDQNNLQRAKQNFAQQQEAMKTNFEQQRLDLDKQANARAQQESILRQDLFHTQIQSAQEALRQGKIKFVWDTANHQQTLMDAYDAHKAAGWTPLPNTPEFDNLTDAAAYANKNFQSVSRASDGTPFATRFVQDPATNKYQILESDNIVRPRKVPIPKELGGGTTIEPLSPHDFSTLLMNYTKAGLEARKTDLEALKTRAEIKRYSILSAQEQSNLKDKNMVSKAFAELDKFDGDGTKVSPSTRLILKRYLSTEMMGYGNLIQKMNMDPTVDKNSDEYKATLGEYQDSARILQSLNGVKVQTQGNGPTIKNGVRDWGNNIPPANQLAVGDVVTGKVYLGGPLGSPASWGEPGDVVSQLVGKKQPKVPQNILNETGLGNLSNPQ